MMITISAVNYLGTSVSVLMDDETWQDALLPAELLDDEVGDNASRSSRTSWVLENQQAIKRAISQKKHGLAVRAPFHRIVLLEGN
ncbi:hypothetical protein [Pseudotabrizicola alkalilacus]|uniref:hypothetical protein n=1 Tax=Pseudotabrizicola alkalilacus TaxID=2305252 RepID=UPI000E4AFB54|nr:hypothetical protein [Pseudotabrizicola alkalilacus]